jgi:uncharacterized protein YceK
MRFLLAFVLCTLVFCSGCGTTVSHVFPADTPVYKGVTVDAREVKDGNEWFLLDLPFSLAGDTILFPIDLYESIPPPDPVKGWNSWGPMDEAARPGGTYNWTSHTWSETLPGHPPLDQAIKDDYQAYAHKVWPKGPDFFISEVEFYEDGTGRHAVKLTLEPGSREYKVYYLMYDKNNVRTKVVRGGTYHQFHI